MTKQNLSSKLVTRMTLVVETMQLPLKTVFVVAVAAVVAAAFFVSG